MFFFFSSRRRHTRCALVTGVQTCALPIYVVAWLVATRESARLAEELIADAIYEQNVPAGQLSLHADRGSSMTSKTVSQLLADLGVEQSHSRPHVSNDNPFSEAQFKTLKYSPTFPKRFTGIDHARSFCDWFFAHYHHNPRHPGIGLHTPADVHYGREIGRAHARTPVT